MRSQPRPSLPVWTSLRSSSASTKGQKPVGSSAPGEVPAPSPVYVATSEVPVEDAVAAPGAAAAASPSRRGTRRSESANSGRSGRSSKGRRWCAARSGGAGQERVGLVGDDRGQAGVLEAVGVEVLGRVRFFLLLRLRLGLLGCFLLLVLGRRGRCGAPLRVGRAEGVEVAARDRHRRLDVHRGRRRGVRMRRVADVVGEGRGDLLRGLDGQRVLGGLLAQHPFADRVEGPGYAGPHLPWSQRAAPVARCPGHGRPGDAGPAAGERGVEDAGEVDHVGLAVVDVAVHRVGRRGALQAGVDDVADQLHRPGLGQQHGPRG